MIRIWRRCATAYETVSMADFAPADDIVWIDLLDPTRDEELVVEKAVGVGLPTREDMAEIELSSRLYKDDGATFMTALAVCKSQAVTGQATLGPVTFALVGERLITVRYVKPHAFDIFVANAARSPEMCGAGPHVFLGLLDAMVDRMADLLEQLGAEIETTADGIFERARGQRFQLLMRRLGRHQSFSGKAHESLVSIARVAAFAATAPQIETDAIAGPRLQSLRADVASLVEHVGYQTANLSFLLEAAVGLIGIEQNEISRIFSVTAVILMPPTLVGAIYGMNFEHMPELRWAAGYPIALILMVISGLIPFLWVRYKRWL